MPDEEVIWSDEDEYIPVPESEQLDRDPEPTVYSDNTALSETTGDDTADLDDHRDPDGAVWGGPDGGEE